MTTTMAMTNTTSSTLVTLLLEADQDDNDDEFGLKMYWWQKCVFFVSPKASLAWLGPLEPLSMPCLLPAAVRPAQIMTLSAPGTCLAATWLSRHTQHWHKTFQLPQFL